MHDLVYLRAPRALNDSNGNHWPAPGAVVGVPREQAVELLAIQDAGFVVVDAPVKPARPVVEPAPAPAAVVTEPAPAVESPAEAPAPRPRKPRKPVTE